MEAEKEKIESVDLRAIVPQIILFDMWDDEPLCGVKFEFDKDQKDDRAEGSVLGNMVNHLFHRLIGELVQSKPVTPPPTLLDTYEAKNSVLIQVDDYQIGIDRDLYESFYGPITEVQLKMAKGQMESLERQYKKEIEQKQVIQKMGDHIKALEQELEGLRK